jgi:hypothetical protein
VQAALEIITAKANVQSERRQGPNEGPVWIDFADRSVALFMTTNVLSKETSIKWSRIEESKPCAN